MSSKRILTFILIILALSIISILYNPNPTGQATKQAEYPKEPATLLRVIDGDTIEARVGEETWKIRMLGINTPEKNMPFSEEAKKYLQQFENKTIYLQRDKEDTDKYKRKLRYAFYQNRFLNLEILEAGFANSYYSSGLKYENEILRAESQSRNLELGIWKKSSEECAVQNCISLEELNASGEYFKLKNICSFDCVLEGWFVKDAGRNKFMLESLSLGQEQIYSSEGKEIWNNEGDKLFIFDEDGFLVLYYSYTS